MNKPISIRMALGPLRIKVDILNIRVVRANLNIGRCPRAGHTNHRIDHIGVEPVAPVKYLNEIAGGGIGDTARSIAISGQMGRCGGVICIEHGVEGAHADEGTCIGITV